MLKNSINYIITVDNILFRFNHKAGEKRSWSNLLSECSGNVIGLGLSQWVLNKEKKYYFLTKK
jgi:hypothetical protein